MTGNQLKELLEILIKRDDLCRGICQKLLNDLDTIGWKTLEQEYIEKCFKILNLMYKLKYSNNNQWGELYDREFADWKRVRAAMEHENLLINQRLTWLFLSQTVLFTALTAAFIELNKDLEKFLQHQSFYIVVFFTIAFSGTLISIHIWRITASAVIQINRLESWWYRERGWNDVSEPKKLLVSEFYNHELEILKNHPPLKGRPSTIIGRDWINTETVPLLFLGIWIVVDIFLCINYWKLLLDVIIIFAVIIVLYKILTRPFISLRNKIINVSKFLLHFNLKRESRRLIRRMRIELVRLITDIKTMF